MADLIVALDLPARTKALDLVDRLGTAADFYKVGLELFTRAGPGIVSDLGSRGQRVFLDLKLHDIPNTVAGASAAAAELGVDLLTVHASGGGRMVEAARRAVEGSATRILAVTVLTSLSSTELATVWHRGDVSSRDEVTRLAALASSSGAHGVVAAVGEAAALRNQLGPEALIVTPGIRFSDQVADDQVRVATPGEAVRAGADFLVVGRTVSQAADPAAAVARIRAEMEMEMEEA